MPENLDTHRRALAVNLDPTSYGTFAEIGAGQEVARWFLQVGAAAGTVAKTISAYDMAFSDAIYGKTGRYVSRERLVAMLDHEYPQLLERLGAERGAKSRFFVFADTVSARNYAGTNECHGWMGIRFQTKPGGKPNDLLLHVNLRDPTNLQQQQALGVLGVNLTYAAFFQLRMRGRILDALFANLSLEHIEIDFVELSGPAFERADDCALGVEIVRQGLATAVVMDGDDLVPPTEFLRKRPIVIERHAVRGPISASSTTLAAASRQLAGEMSGLERPPLGLREVCVVPPEGERAPGSAAILRRASELDRGDVAVLVTRHVHGFQLARYLRRYTREPLVYALPVGTLVAVLSANADRERAGHAFETFGRLMGEGVRLFVEPQPAAEFQAELRRADVDPRRVRAPERGTVRLEDVGLPAPNDRLLDYLCAAGWLLPIEKRRPRAAGAARAPRAPARR